MQNKLLNIHNKNMCVIKKKSIKHIQTKTGNKWIDYLESGRKYMLFTETKGDKSGISSFPYQSVWCISIIQDGNCYTCIHEIPHTLA